MQCIRCQYVWQFWTFCKKILLLLLIVLVVIISLNFFSLYQLPINFTVIYSYCRRGITGGLSHITCMHGITKGFTGINTYINKLLFPAFFSGKKNCRTLILGIYKITLSFHFSKILNNLGNVKQKLTQVFLLHLLTTFRPLCYKLKPFT